MLRGKDAGLFCVEGVAVVEKSVISNNKAHDKMHDSMEELYRRFLDGDNAAFESLVALNLYELSRFIYGIVHDYHEAEHLTIETFAQLALNTKPFEGKSTLKTYIYGIAKNLTSQHMKKRKRDLHTSFEEIAELSIDNGESVQTALEKNERKQYLMDAMRGLKEEYRAVLILLYFEGMSYRQAGSAMNKSEKQIKDLAYRAKASLRKKLEVNDSFA